MGCRRRNWGSKTLWHQHAKKVRFGRHVQELADIKAGAGPSERRKAMAIPPRNVACSFPLLQSFLDCSSSPRIFLCLLHAAHVQHFTNLIRNAPVFQENYLFLRDDMHPSLLAVGSSRKSTSLQLAVQGNQPKNAHLFQKTFSDSILQSKKCELSRLPRSDASTIGRQRIFP